MLVLLAMSFCVGQPWVSGEQKYRWPSSLHFWQGFVSMYSDTVMCSGAYCGCIFGSRDSVGGTWPCRDHPPGWHIMDCLCWPPFSSASLGTARVCIVLVSSMRSVTLKMSSYVAYAISSCAMCRSQCGPLFVTLILNLPFVNFAACILVSSVMQRSHSFGCVIMQLHVLMRKSFPSCRFVACRSAFVIILYVTYAERRGFIVVSLHADIGHVWEGMSCGLSSAAILLTWVCVWLFVAFIRIPLPSIVSILCFFSSSLPNRFVPCIWLSI